MSDVANCPKCGKSFDETYENEWCTKCGEYFPDDLKMRLPKVAATVAAASANVVASRDPRSQVSAVDIVNRRYRDAYLVAKVVVGLGNGIKMAGAIAAVAVFLWGLTTGGTIGIAFGTVAGLVGAVICILGVLIAAQGQTQYAMLDVAVNSSPILPVEDKARLVVGSTIEAPAALHPTLQSNGVISPRSAAAVPAYRLCSACGARHTPDVAMCHCKKQLDSDPLFTTTGQRYTDTSL